MKLITRAISMSGILFILAVSSNARAELSFLCLYEKGQGKQIVQHVQRISFSHNDKRLARQDLEKMRPVQEWNDSASGYRLVKCSKDTDPTKEIEKVWQAQLEDGE